MFKQVANWHLSILVIIVSVLSLLLVQQYVFAQWQDPTTSPGQSGSTKLVVTPMVADLDLNGKSITDTDFSLDPGGTIGLEISGGTWAGYFTGDVKVTGDLDVGTINGSTPGSLWNESGSNIYYNVGNVGIGTNNPSSLLHLYDKSGSLQFSSTGIYEAIDIPLDISAVNEISFQTAAQEAMVVKQSGYVGIGTNSPNKKLHVYDATGNAEIDIESGLGVSGHWGIYQDATTSDLRFWNTDNIVTFTDEGYVGIGKTNPTRTLDVEGDAITAIHGEVSTDTTYAIHGENNVGTAIFGQGMIAVQGEATQANGTAIYGQQSSGAYAGYFRGTVRITDSSSGIGYLHLNTTDVDPPSTDCDSVDERGRIIYNYVDDYLYICDYDPADPSGGGRKIYPQIAF